MDQREAGLSAEWEKEDRLLIMSLMNDVRQPDGLAEKKKDQYRPVSRLLEDMGLYCIKRIRFILFERVLKLK